MLGQAFSHHTPPAYTRQTARGVKTKLWSEKKIIVRSGNALCLHDDDEPPPPPKTEGGWDCVTAGGGGGGGVGMPLSTRDSKTRGGAGVGKGVGKDNPNKHLEDILPSAPKLITVPQWRWHLWEATHNMTGWSGLCFPLKTWANGQGLAVVDARNSGGMGRWSNEWPGPPPQISTLTNPTDRMQHGVPLTLTGSTNEIMDLIYPLQIFNLILNCFWISEIKINWKFTHFFWKKKKI